MSGDSLWLHLVLQEPRPVEERLSHIRMLRTQNLLSYGLRPLMQRLSLRVFALDTVNDAATWYFRVNVEKRNAEEHYHNHIVRLLSNWATSGCSGTSNIPHMTCYP